MTSSHLTLHSFHAQEKRRKPADANSGLSHRLHSRSCASLSFRRQNLHRHHHSPVLLPLHRPNPSLSARTCLPQSEHAQHDTTTMFPRKKPSGTTTRSAMSMEGNGPRIGCWGRIRNTGLKSEHRAYICYITPGVNEKVLRYPKQQRLLSLKKTSVSAHALPPSYISFAELSTLNPSKFDVILIDPPFSSAFTWDDLQELPVPSLAADPSFVLLWVGSGAGEGLERGRQVLAKWGFRRCEDIVWIKTNHDSNRGPGVRHIAVRSAAYSLTFRICLQTDPPTTSLLTRTKQHCLMGIRGTVRRSTDSWFVHCNVGSFPREPFLDSTMSDAARRYRRHDICTILDRPNS